MLKNKSTIILIITAAIVIRIIAMFLLGDPIIHEYEEISLNILNGDGFTFNFLDTQHFATTEPFYPYLTSLVYSVFGVNHLAMVIAQILFSMLLVIVVYLIGKMMIDSKTGLLASFIVAFHPAFIYYDVKNLHPLGLGALFIAVSIWLMILFKKQPSFRMASLVGVISGVGTLVRGTVGSFFVLGVIWCYFQLRKTNKIYAYLLVMLSCFLLAIAPWCVRNYIHLKKIIPIRSTVSVTFWYGNNEYATGSSLSADGRDMRHFMSDEMKKKVYGAPDEVSQNLIFKEEAEKFIRNNPKQFLALTLRKAFYFWWFSPQSGFLYPKLSILFYKGFYLIFLILFLAGIYFVFQSRNKKLISISSLLMIMFFSVTFVHALTYVDCRHRWGIEPLMALFAAFSIYKLKGIIKK